MKKPNAPRRLDRAAFAKLEQYRARLQRFLEHRSRATHSANDLAQEVYLRLLRFPPEEAIIQPQAYLYRIASNVVHDFNTRLGNERLTFDTDGLDERAQQACDIWADEVADRLSADQELERLLGELPPLQQAALILRKRDGLSYPEIATELNVSVHTVKKYIARAIAHCRSAGARRPE